MTTLIKMFMFIVLTIFISACTPTYNIEPKYNLEKDQIKIDTLEFNNITENFDKSKNTISEGNFLRKRKSYFTNDTECKSLTYSSIQAGHRSYIGSDLEIDLRELSKTKQIKCTINKISNIKFTQCKINNDFNRYFISTSVVSEYGGFSKSESLSTHKNCFYKLKEHFTNKSLKDDVKIKIYSFSSN